MFFVFCQNILGVANKLLVPANTRVTLDAESDFNNADYIWTINKKNGDLIETVNGKNFNRPFPVEGIFLLNTTATDRATGDSRFTQTELIVGKPQTYFDDFKVRLESIPEANDKGEIYFEGGTGEVVFYFGDSGSVEKIEIDKDTNLDSDGNGKANDDIDNKETIVDKMGGKHSQIYSSSEGSDFFNTKIKFIGFGGQEEIKEFKVYLNVKTAQKSGDLKAVLKSIPKANTQDNTKIKEIYAPFNTNEVFLYMKDSKGDFLEYRIDEDTNEDSDGDGIADNDIDNIKHNSFKTGDFYSIKKGTKESQIVKFTLVSGKKGIKIERKIFWAKENPYKFIEVFPSSSKTYVGNEIIAGVSGLNGTGEKLTVDWDFEDDGIIDLSGEDFVKIKYKSAGIYNIKIIVKNEKGDIVKTSRVGIEVDEKPTQEKLNPPEVSFGYKINGPNAGFEESVKVDEKLEKKDYELFWKFGDGNISKESKPVFVYKNLGNYTVELIATDSLGNKGSSKGNVEIKSLNLEKVNPDWLEIPPDLINYTDSGTGIIAQKSLSSTGTGFFTKVGNYISSFFSTSQIPADPNLKQKNSIILIILFYTFLVIGGIFLLFFLYLIFQKIKNPDYTFGEIIEEEKEKFFAFVEGEPYEPVNNPVISKAEDKKIDSDLEKEKKDFGQIKSPELKKEPEVVVKETPKEAPKIEVNVSIPQNQTQVQEKPKVEEAQKIKTKGTYNPGVMPGDQDKKNIEKPKGVGEDKEDKKDDSKIPDWLK